MQPQNPLQIKKTIVIERQQFMKHEIIKISSWRVKKEERVVYYVD